MCKDNHCIIIRIKYVIEHLIKQLNTFNIVIINGDCSGADKLSTDITNELKLETILYPVSKYPFHHLQILIHHHLLLI